MLGGEERINGADSDTASGFVAQVNGEAVGAGPVVEAANDVNDAEVRRNSLGLFTSLWALGRRFGQRYGVRGRGCSREARDR